MTPHKKAPGGRWSIHQGQHGKSHCYENVPDDAVGDATKRLMDSVDIAALLRATPLEGFVKPSDCRVITPEEFDEKYGDDDEE